MQSDMARSWEPQICQFGDGGTGELLSHSASPKALLPGWRGQCGSGTAVWVPAAMFIIDIAQMPVVCSPKNVFAIRGNGEVRGQSWTALAGLCWII